MKNPFLSWYKTQGIHHVVGNTPQNQYAPPAVQFDKKSPVTPQPLTPHIKQHVSKEHPAWACNTLEELHTAMKNFTGCPLKEFAHHTVFARGNPKAPIMIVGEAPGAEEDQQGLPFVGQSGQLLDKALQTIGLNETNMYISNIIPWRPPGNRPPTTLEVAACQPFIERHIELVAPRILILAGGVAAKTLLNMADGITRLRGKWVNYKPRPDHGNSIDTMAIYHPAYLLRSPGQKAALWHDLLIIEKKLASA